MKEYKALIGEEYGYKRISRNKEIPYKKIEEKITCKDGGYSLAVDAQYSDKKKVFLKVKNIA